MNGYSQGCPQSNCKAGLGGLEWGVFYTTLGSSKGKRGYALPGCIVE